MEAAKRPGQNVNNVNRAINKELQRSIAQTNASPHSFSSFEKLNMALIRIYMSH